MTQWVLIALTFLTLIVLVKYAWDTRTIARASAAQPDNSQMPFLAVAMIENAERAPGGWAIANQGFGPALNIHYSVYDARVQRSLRFMASVAKGGEYRAAHNEIANAFGLALDFEITYESLSGRKYRTIVKMIPGTGLQTEFQKL